MMNHHKLDALAYLHASPALAFKLEDASSAGEISGWASLFDNEPDSYGDIIGVNAYARSLAEHEKLGTLPAMLWSHDPSVPVGRWVEVKQDARGLFCRGKFNLDVEPGRRAYSHVKENDARGLSIGYSIFEGGFTYNANGTRTLSQIDVREVSIVTLPAKRQAMITSVKAAFSSRDELEAILRGVVPARCARKILEGGWKALAPGADEPDPYDPLLAALRAARRKGFKL